MKIKYNLRAITAIIIEQVVEQGKSLTTVLPEFQRKVNEKDQSLLQELSFGCLRTLSHLQWLINQLMAKPLNGKQRTLHYLIMVGLYQLIYSRIPPHAAVGETVNGAISLKRPQLKGLINGVLRQFIRQNAFLEQQFQENDARFLHPEWLFNRIKKAYPQQWQHILEENNQKPPMWLRVNRNYQSPENYINLLEQVGIKGETYTAYPDAIHLITPCPVTVLPGFDLGWVSVQDAAAQTCAQLLAPEDNDLILDLCAAPGGKTTHILEIAPKAQVIAVDIDQVRLNRVKENLQRLKLSADVICGDGQFPEKWINNRMFDRILLDAPCSASGVIRRHPDIKWLRRDEDIHQLTTLQKSILQNIWPYLKQGGTLVYATCSILPEENTIQIADFLSTHSDAILQETGCNISPGWQKLPEKNGGDGFFYAKITKQKSKQ